MKKFSFLPAMLFACSAFAAGAPNLTGQWSVHNSIAGHESDTECKLVQTDDKLTGTCISNDKDVEVTGSLDGNKATWTYDTEYNGTPITLTYTVTLDDSGKMAGEVEVQPFNVMGEFTAVTSKEAAK